MTDLLTSETLNAISHTCALFIRDVNTELKRRTAAPQEASPFTTNPSVPHFPQGPTRTPTEIAHRIEEAKAMPSMQIPRIPVQQAEPQRGPSSVVDSTGQPWNPNVHSSSKKFNKDGTWRVKRGLDPAVLATPTQPTAHPQQPVAPPTFSPPPPVQVPQAPPTQAAPAQTVQPTTETVIRGNDIYAVPNAQGVHAHTFASFKDNLIPVFASLIQEGKIDQAYVDSLKKYFGIKELWNLFTDDKKLLELFENFCGANLIQRIEG